MRGKHGKLRLWRAARAAKLSHSRKTQGKSAFSGNISGFARHFVGPGLDGTGDGFARAFKAMAGV
jgi:hypothetical protein